MTLPGNVPPPSLPGQVIFLWRPCVADIDDDNVLGFRGQYSMLPRGGNRGTRDSLGLRAPTRRSSSCECASAGATASPLPPGCLAVRGCGSWGCALPEPHTRSKPVAHLPTNGRHGSSTLRADRLLLPRSGLHRSGVSKRSEEHTSELQ